MPANVAHLFNFLPIGLDLETAVGIQQRMIRCFLNAKPLPFDICKNSVLLTNLS